MVINVNKIKIGVFPTIKERDNNYLKSYDFLERYLLPLINEDVTPILLIALNKEYLIEELKKCDALLIPGGSEANPLIYDALEYAYQNKLPVLGICLGMQMICSYSMLKNEKEWSKEKIKEIEDFVIRPIGNDAHHQVKEKYDNLDQADTEIFIEPTSRLYKYFNKQKVVVKCFHDDAVYHIDKLLKVTSFAKDGILESVESKSDDWLLVGVQFHPELSKENQVIKGFINDVKDDIDARNSRSRDSKKYSKK